jgi:serine/threonine-protein kinase
MTFGSPSASDRLGTTVAGKYHLLRLLGQGGMGAVYEAENTWTGRRVAVKVLLPAFSLDENIVRRFMMEARAASSIQHPNIVEVLDLGRDPTDGTFYMVLELLHGRDFSALLREAPGMRLPLDGALEVLLPVMRALSVAHERGIVHRDVKPANIFLTRGPSGELVPKLIDFGISKVLTNENFKHTHTGAVIGTPRYLSPEQARGDREIDTRTDIWAAGVVLFESLSGRSPFDGTTANMVLAQVINVGLGFHPVPRLADVAPALPPPVTDAIQRALEPDPAGRYASMRDFIDALCVARAQRDATPTPRSDLSVRPAQRRAYGLTAALFSVGFLTLVALFFVSHKVPSSQPPEGTRPTVSTRLPRRPQPLPEAAVLPVLIAPRETTDAGSSPTSAPVAPNTRRPLRLAPPPRSAPPLRPTATPATTPAPGLTAGGDYQ